MGLGMVFGLLQVVVHRGGRSSLASHDCPRRETEAQPGSFAVGSVRKP